MLTATTEDFHAVLNAFQERFNGNPRARKLVTDWNRDVLLDALDTERRFMLVVHDRELKEVRPVHEFDDEADGLVHLQADERILIEIFSGRYNPATALTDGALAVFSPDRDKVKLEALAMVIWRLG